MCCLSTFLTTFLAPVSSHSPRCGVQGMDSGFAGGDDEVYNVYDKPWRQDKDLAGNLYRPSKNIEKDVYGDDLDKLIKANRSVCVLMIVITFLFI